MKTKFNEDTKRHEWILNKWHEKTAMVIGYLSATFFIGSFLIGFVIGLSQSLHP